MFYELLLSLVGIAFVILGLRAAVSLMCEISEAIHSLIAQRSEQRPPTAVTVLIRRLMPPQTPLPRFPPTRNGALFDLLAPILDLAAGLRLWGSATEADGRIVLRAKSGLKLSLLVLAAWLTLSVARDLGDGLAVKVWRLAAALAAWGLAVLALLYRTTFDDDGLSAPQPLRPVHQRWDDLLGVRDDRLLSYVFYFRGGHRLRVLKYQTEIGRLLTHAKALLDQAAAPPASLFDLRGRGNRFSIPDGHLPPVHRGGV